MKKISTIISESRKITCAEYAQRLNISDAFPKNQSLYKALMENSNKTVASVFDDATAFTVCFCDEIAKAFTSEKIAVMLDCNYSQSHYVCDPGKKLHTRYISFVYSEQNKRAFQCTFTGKFPNIKLDACCTNSRAMREKFQKFESETRFKVFPKFIAYREHLNTVDNVQEVVDEFKKALSIILNDPLKMVHRST